MMFGSLKGTLAVAKSYTASTGMRWETVPNAPENQTIHRLLAPAGIILQVIEFSGHPLADVSVLWYIRPEQPADALMMLAIRLAEIYGAGRE